MIDKSVNYNDKDFSKNLKGLGLSKEEIKYILGETKRKKFDDGGSSGDGSSGDGSSGDGDSSSAGDSGPGGSDDGSGHGGPGGSDSGPGGSDDGTGHGGPGPGDTGSVGPSTEGFGIGPDAAAEAEASNAANAATTGVVGAVTNAVQAAIANAVNNPVATAIGIAMGPVAGMAARGIAAAVDAANRGVTAPDDFSQAQTSVQSNTQSPTNSGGISTIADYAPTYNPDTGNPTMDAYMRRLRVNLGLPV